MATETQGSYFWWDQFWKGLFQYLPGQGIPVPLHKKVPSEATKYASIISVGGGISINVCVLKTKRLRVEIYCSNNPQRELYKKLSGNKDAIDRKFGGAQVRWEAEADQACWRIWVSRPCDSSKANGDTPYRRDLYKWISDNIKIFKEVADSIFHNASASPTATGESSVKVAGMVS